MVSYNRLLCKGEHVSSGLGYIRNRHKIISKIRLWEKLVFVNVIVAIISRDFKKWVFFTRVEMFTKSDIVTI